MVVRATAAVGERVEGKAGAMQEFRGAGRPGGKPNRRHRSSGSGVAAAPVSLLALALMLGAASAIGPDLPAIYKVLHANVVFRHGERTRLVKTVGGASEFGLNDDVVVSEGGVSYECTYVFISLSSNIFAHSNIIISLRNQMSRI